VRRKRGEPLAVLSVPRLGLSTVVLEGSDDGVLKKGPGHVEETAFPGELGNVAIAGHRDTHFRPLRDIQVNDEIVLKTKTSTLRYFVDSAQIIQPTDMEVLDPTPGPALTLLTCYPFEYVGNAPMRFVIRATPRTTGGGGDAQTNH
jgi:sortase A